MRQGVDVLVDGADGRVEGGLLDGLGQLHASGLHEGAVEGAAHCQRQGFAFGLFHQLAGPGHTLVGAADDQLARAVVVCRHDDLALDGGADVLDGLVVELEHGGHGGGGLLAALLHGVGAGDDQSQAILEAHGAGGDEGRELAQRVAAHHVGLKGFAHILGQNDAVEEDGRLSDAGLLQVLRRAGEHEVGDAEADDFIGTLKHGTALVVAVVEILAHAHKLGSLAGEYVCFHLSLFRC